MSLIFASWNQLAGWLSQIEVFEPQALEPA
jgi:hypothetical protein